METELCNMCMITDQKGRLLVQDRLPKLSNARSGLTHVELGKTVGASVIREVREKTGLTITDVVPVGHIQWYNRRRSKYCFK